MLLFPNKKYDIIYADVPWDYSYLGKNFDRQFTKSKYKFDAVMSAKEHYPTMKIAELKDLPIQSICNKDCLFFIWITNPHIDIGMKLIDYWGFDYKTVAFVWFKKKHNPGFYTMSECELCFVAKKKGGNIPSPRGARNIRQFYAETRTVHSKKPDEFRKRIELMFPSQSKIELFARKTIPGWDNWGNEVNKFDNEIPKKLKQGFFE